MKIIYSGEKTGNVQISLDGGATWSETMTLETLKTEGFHIENDSQDFEKIKIKNSAGTAVDVVNVVSSIKNNDVIEPEYITGLVIKSIYGTNIKNTYSNLTSITIPEGTTKIREYAFQDFSRLKNINIPEGITEIESYAFGGCSGLTEINLPESLVYISNGAFSYCSGLTEINIPNNVSLISMDAFRGCSSLIKIIIPASVRTIGENAFAGCTNLTDIYYDGSQEQWENVSKGENWNNECPAVIHF